MLSAVYQFFQPNARPLRTLSGHVGTTMALFPDGKRLVTGSDDNTIRIWNVGDGRQQGREIENTGNVYVIAVTSDGKNIIAGIENGRIAIWDVETHELVQQWHYAGEFPRMAVSPDNWLVAYRNGWFLVIRELTSGRIKRAIKTDVYSLCFSPDTSKLACASGEWNGIKIYDIDTAQEILTLQGHRGWVWTLKWSHDGTRLYSGSQDETIRCWDTETGRQIGEPWTGPTDKIRSLSLSPDGTKIASGSRDGAVHFWDTSGHLIGHPLKHKSAVCVVGISPLNDIVSVSTHDGNIYIWPLLWSGENQSDGPIGPQAPPIVTDPSESTNSNSSSNTQPPNHVPNVPLARDSPRPEVPRPTVHSTQVPQHLLHVAGDPSESKSSPIADTQKTSQTIDGDDTNPIPAPLDLTRDIVRVDEQQREIGGFGDVHKCVYNGPSGAKEVAVKALRFVFTLDDGDTKVAKIVRRELGVWKRLEHPNIVPFLGIATGFGMKGSTSIVSLWMPNGTLDQFLKDHDSELTIEHRLQILMDVAIGLGYLHSWPNTPIIHGDLNCNNVLIDSNRIPRLTDFGLYSLISSIPQGLTYLGGSTARPGTLRWNAPEQLEVGYERRPQSDIYSFGCISLQVFSGRKPWEEIREDAAVVLRLARGQNPMRPTSRPIEDRHWQFIESCWRPVEERPTAGMLISSLKELLNTRPLDLTPYIVKLEDRYLNGGSFGDVYRCHYNNPGKVVAEVAVKSFRFEFTLEEGDDVPHVVKMVRRELGIWRRLDHPNIVPFLGTATGFGMQGSLALVSAWMPNGTLQKFLENRGEQLQIAHQLRILRDIASGLDYLHSFRPSPIIHGDLNGHNVLMDGNFIARLVDFGYSTVVGNIPDALTYLQRSTARPGALRWSAPELVLNEDDEIAPERTTKSDIYSFGCLSLQVFSGKQPWWEVREEGAIAVRMVRGQKPKRPTSRAMEDCYWEFIQDCWSSADERPTAVMLVSSLRDLLSNCPQFPSLRDMFSS